MKSYWDNTISRRRGLRLTAAAAGAVDAQRRELNPHKRIDLAQDFQRYAATALPGLIGRGAALGFMLRQGWIGNADLWHGTDSAMQSFSNNWDDKSKAKALDRWVVATTLRSPRGWKLGRQC